MPNKNKDQPSPTQKRRQELIAQANEIRRKQAGGKDARTSKLDQIKRLDEQVRSRIAEQKTAKSKVNFKSVEDVDRQIAALEKEVNSGKMKLVDEKKALSDASNLRKVRKNFGQFDESQKQIDEIRAKIKEIKDSMDDPEQRAMSEQYNKIQAELDTIKAEQDEAYKGINSLRDERTKLQAEQQEKYTAIRKIKDDYYGAKKAYMAYDREAREKQRQRRQAEHDQYIKDKKKAAAERVLDDASDPAYLEEIRRANSLLQFLDPSHKVEKGPLMAETGLSAQAQRTVDDGGLKGTKLLRKEDRGEDYAPAVKKGKKGKKGGAAAGTSKFFSCPPAVVEDCAFIGVDPPMGTADVPDVIEKVRAKLDHWKNDQAPQTQRVSFSLNPTCNFAVRGVLEANKSCRTLRRPRRRLRDSKRRKPTAPTVTMSPRSPRVSRTPLLTTSRSHSAKLHPLSRSWLVSASHQPSLVLRLDPRQIFRPLESLPNPYSRASTTGLMKSLSVSPFSPLNKIFSLHPKKYMAKQFV